MKEFLKSTGFKSVAVLLAICIVCVALLALCSDIFAVSETEQFRRAMLKIYPNPDAKFLSRTAVTGDDATNFYGTISAVTMAVDVNDETKEIAAIIEAVGGGGWVSGTVTLYVVISAEGKIEGWSIKDYDSVQNYMPQLFPYQSIWYIGTEISENKIPQVFWTTGKTADGGKNSTTSINNAINAAAAYANTVLLYGEQPEPPPEIDAGALLELIKEHPIFGELEADDFESQQSSTQWINANMSWVSDKVKGVALIKTATVDEGVVAALHFDTGETDDKDEPIYDILVILVPTWTELDDSKRFVHVATDEFDEDIINEIKYHVEGTGAVITEVDGTTYTIKGSSSGPFNGSIGGDGPMASDYILKVTVTGGVITNIVIVKDGFVDGDPSHTNANKLIGALVTGQATLTSFSSVVSSGIASGASHSGHIIENIAFLALSYYAANNA